MFLKEVVTTLKDQVNTEDVRKEGFMLNVLQGWMDREVDILDDSGESIPLTRYDLLVKQLVSKNIFNSISQFCKDEFVKLHPENWNIFERYSDKTLISRILRKFLPITNLSRFGVDLNDPKMQKEILSTSVFLSLNHFFQLKPLAVITGMEYLIKKNLKDVVLATGIVNLFVLLAIENSSYSGWINKVLSHLLSTTRDKVGRRVFKHFIAMNRSSMNVLDALLVSGSLSKDTSLEILRDIEQFDESVVDQFLYHEARVVHRNYFLRLFTLKDLSILNSKMMKELIQHARNTITPIEVQEGESQGGAEKEGEVEGKVESKVEGKGKREYRAKEEDIINYARTTLDMLIIKYLMKSNPWALIRQYTSWLKRISIESLEKERLEILKSSISRLMERGRRRMIFSDEFRLQARMAGSTREAAKKVGIQEETFLSKRWKSHSYFTSKGVSIKGIDIKEIADLYPNAAGVSVIAKDLENIIQNSEGIKKNGQDGQDASNIHVLEIPEGIHIPGPFPLEFKNDPWISIKSDEITGLGLSGLRLKKIPRSVRELPSLKILDLSNNIIKKIKSLEGLEGLKHVDLSRNNLYAFDVGEIEVPGLITLDLHGNFLKSTNVKPFTKSLKVLDVSRNQLTSLIHIDQLGNCKKLSILNVSWNRLRDLNNLPLLPNLRLLFARGNLIDKLVIENPYHPLTWLDVSSNKLGGMNGIDKFPNLFRLEIQRNYLKHVVGVKNLSKLSHLDVSNNQIDDINEALGIPGLKKFIFHKNPLSKMPKDLIRQFS
ncbi:MAG: leucine-rich repeat domain-containing protein [Promethearchaeota archaeon]